jgi:23S rRNA A1618 N6-methylase RlmF
VSDNVSRGQQAAEEVARRWISTMQAMADQIQRQQQTLQQMMQDQMSSYVQLLNAPPFYVSQQPQEEGQRATGQTFHQASELWMQLAQRQQQSFQEVAEKSLSAYMDLFKLPR